MKKILYKGVIGIIFLAGCSTVPQKSLSTYDEKSLEVQIKQAKAIAETSLEISKNAEDIANTAVETSILANATSEKALETANKAVSAINETKEFATKEVERAIKATNEASEKVVKAANDAIKAANDATEKATNAANEAIAKANEASEKAIKVANEASEKAIAVANQMIAEINKVRASIKMAPIEEPILEKEPTVKKKYKVMPGDTLTSISKKFYNDSSKWKLIYQHNKNVISDPNHLKAGTEIFIP